MIRAVASIVALAAGVAGQASVIDCSAGQGLFTLDAASLAPAIPVSGKNETLDITYTVPSEVAAGTADYSCVLNGIPIFHEKYDLCSQTACPITAGQHHDVSQTAVPDFTGKLTCTINWSNAASQQLLCLQMTMKIAAALRGAASKGKMLDFIPAAVDNSEAIPLHEWVSEERF